MLVVVTLLPLLTKVTTQSLTVFIHKHLNASDNYIDRQGTTGESISKQSLLQFSDVWPSTDRSQLARSLRENHA